MRSYTYVPPVAGLIIVHSGVHHRALVTLAKRGRGNTRDSGGEEKIQAERRAAMTWAQRLKRIFNIDIETCPACGGAVRIIACIEDTGGDQKDPRSPEKKGRYQNARPAAREPGATGRSVRLTFTSFNPFCCYPQGTAGELLA